MQNLTATDEATADFDWDTPGPFDDLYAAIDEIKLHIIDLAVSDPLIAAGFAEAHTELVRVRDRIVVEYPASKAAA